MAFFTISVLEVEVSSEEDVEGLSTTSVNLGFAGMTINVNFDFELKAEEKPLEVMITRVTQTGEVYLKFSKPMQKISNLEVYT